MPYRDLRKRERNKEKWRTIGLVYCKCGCGQTRPEFDGQGRRGYYINGHSGRGKQNGMYGKRGTLHPCYRGAESITSSGYLVLRVDGKMKYKHVKIFEEYHRCCMLKWGVVHHLDRNTLNNDISNLEGMTRHRHQSMHSKKKYEECKHERTEEITLSRCTHCGSFRRIT